MWGAATSNALMLRRFFACLGRLPDGCAHFTYDPSSSLCFLKRATGIERSSAGLISGHAAPS